MRALRRLLVVLVVLGLLGAVVDYAARRTVEGLVATGLKQTQSLAETPEVTVHGIPFLTQLAGGRFGHISVRSSAAHAGSGLTVDAVDAELRGVRVPVKDLLRGGVPHVSADDVQLAGVVPYATVTKLVAAQLQGRLQKVSVTHTGDGVLRVSGAVRGVPLQVPLRLTLSGNAVVAAVPAETVSGLPSVVRGVVQALVVKLLVPKLPYGLTVRTLQAADDGLHLGASATGVRLG